VTTTLTPTPTTSTQALPDVAPAALPTTATPTATPTTPTPRAATPSGTHRSAVTALAELREGRWASVELDLVEFRSDTPRGAALLSLAARAWAAVRALGRPAGLELTHGPGAVVVRDPASSAALLDAALDPVLLRRLG
jgi:hypothetical protein